MFIRLFAECDDKETALDIYRNVTDGIKENVENEEIVDVKPYWKMKGIFVVEAEMDLKRALNGEEFHYFLSFISDKWLRFGDPTDEFLASVTTEGCKYMKKGVYMINIHFS
jgi:formylmethanofuran:tetrahydromethanopterin formyltransferase